MYINGEFVKGTGKIEARFPFNGSVSGEAPKSGEKEALAAISAARNSFRKNKLIQNERSELLSEISRLMLKKEDELANAITLEMGKPITQSRGEVKRAAFVFKLAGEEARQIRGELLNASAAPGFGNQLGLVFRQPLGVVLAITPFNYPLVLGAHKIAPAIAAGNSTILKPPCSNPLSAMELSKIFDEANAPKGIFNAVCGPSGEIGNLLVGGEVDAVTFTGSTEVGEHISKTAGIKKVKLELGGNDALIVLEDAGLEKAAKAAADGAVDNAGQKCTGVKRILVHDSVADEFSELLSKNVSSKKMGDPRKEETDIGPLASESAAEEIENRVNDAVKKGAKLLCGGKRQGAFFEPTALDNVNEKFELVCFETFGPIAPITRFSELDDALRIANSTPYGLQSAVFTQSLEKARYCWERIDAGAVNINLDTGFRGGEHMPFGGVKKSGIGREGVKYAVEEFTSLKRVSF